MIEMIAEMVEQDHAHLRRGMLFRSSPAARQPVTLVE